MEDLVKLKLVYEKSIDYSKSRIEFLKEDILFFEEHKDLYSNDLKERINKRKEDIKKEEDEIKENLVKIEEIEKKIINYYSESPFYKILKNIRNVNINDDLSNNTVARTTRLSEYEVEIVNILGNDLAGSFNGKLKELLKAFLILSKEKKFNDLLRSLI